MTYYPAKTAKLMTGASVIAGVTGFNVNESIDVEDTTTINSASKSKSPQLADWTLSWDMYVDSADAGQSAVVAAYSGMTELAVAVYYDGTNHRDGTVIVKSIQYKVSKGGNLMASVSCEGTGALGALGV